jgi:hypothetical protein
MHVRGGLWQSNWRNYVGTSLSLRGEKASITITKGKIEEVRVQGGWCLVGWI